MAAPAIIACLESEMKNGARKKIPRHRIHGHCAFSICNDLGIGAIAIFTQIDSHSLIVQIVYIKKKYFVVFCVRCGLPVDDEISSRERDTWGDQGRLRDID